jgi:hypothetical protein
LLTGALSLNVWRRVGFSSDRTQIFLDLANPQREVVEISPTGWTTTARAGAYIAHPLDG